MSFLLGAWSVVIGGPYSQKKVMGVTDGIQSKADNLFWLSNLKYVIRGAMKFLTGANEQVRMLSSARQTAIRGACGEVR
jgi:hypothetical protein